jgi:hypothetical protein
MLAYQPQHEIQFAFPPIRTCFPRCSSSRKQFAVPSNSNLPPSKPHLGDRISVSLQFELSSFEFTLARQLELEIHFARISNWSSSCWRTSYRSRRQFVFPSDPRDNSRFPPIPSCEFMPAYQLQHETILVSLQFVFRPIRVSLQFQF